MLSVIGWLLLMLGISAADSPAPGHLYAMAMVLAGCLTMLRGQALDAKKDRQKAAKSKHSSSISYPARSWELHTEDIAIRRCTR